MMKLIVSASESVTEDVQPPHSVPDSREVAQRGVEAEAEMGTESDACQPLSPATMTSPPTTPSSPFLTRIFSQPLLDAKDRRAYEVARQRAKRPEDRRKAKNQKRAGGRKNGGGWFGGVRATERGRDDGDAVVADVPAGCEKGQLVHESLSMVEAIGAVDTDKNVNAREAQPVVRLEDLVRAAKVRREKADGFEVVPHVRAVIALDESDFAGDARGTTKSAGHEFDDWEHVYCSDTSSSDEDEPRKVPSYAQVVSSNMQ